MDLPTLGDSEKTEARCAESVLDQEATMPSDTNSVVDFLKSRKQAADFRSREILWGAHKPKEVYLGTAAQNTLLLNALKRSEKAPFFEFPNSVVDLDAPIMAQVVSEAQVLIENGLRATSHSADSGELVHLGDADQFGFFPLAVQDNNGSTMGQLNLLPASGRVLVEFWATPNLVTPSSIVIPLPDPSVADLVRQFFSHFGDVYGDAARQAAADLFATERLLGMMLDGLAGVTIVLVTGGGGALYLGGAAAGYGMEFLAKLVDRAIEFSPQPSDPADKETLRQVLVTPLTALTLAMSVRQYRKDKRTCEALQALNSFGDWVVDKHVVGPDPSPIEVAGSIMRSTVNPIISIVCTTTKKK